MVDQVFIDGVGEIKLIDGVIRMNVVALEPTEGSDQRNPQLIEQLVMSPPAFLRMVGALSESVRSLQERGILSTPEGDNTDGAKVVSPNFS